MNVLFVIVPKWKYSTLWNTQITKCKIMRLSNINWKFKENTHWMIVIKKFKKNQTKLTVVTATDGCGQRRESLWKSRRETLENTGHGHCLHCGARDGGADDVKIYCAYVQYYCMHQSYLRKAITTQKNTWHINLAFFGLKGKNLKTKLLHISKISWRAELETGTI